MAYPYYQNPYQYYQQPYQPQMIQPPQNMQTAVPQNSIIWVSGEREAQMYPVAPNNAVTLWSQTESVVYVKQADATGKPTMKIYDLVERQDGGCITDRECSKADLDSVHESLKAFEAKVAAITADLETVKGDLYGLSGRKKSGKRAEVTDDDD